VSKLFQRQWLFVFVLTFLVTFGSVTATHSQAPLNRDAAIAEVRSLAASDVEMEIPRRTEFAIKQHGGGKTPGLSDRDIGKIYDQEYSQKNKEKKQNWREILFQNGWAVAVVAFLIAIFQDTVKKWVTTLATTIEKKIYNQFAGTKLFWGIALKKYHQALIGKYHELKIPFRVDRPLKMQDVYVPLKVKGSQNYDLIDANQAVSQYRRLMVTGKPGSGKSMLLKYLTLSEAEGRLQLPDQPVAVLLELFRLSDGSEILPQLVKALEREDFPHGEKFLQQALEKGTILLLLDGLDEVGSAARSSVIQKLKDFLDTYEKCRFVMTCRSQVYRGEFSDRVDRTLEVIEFTDVQMRRFLKAWAMPPEKSIDQLMQMLRDRPRILELARNPLLLTIIAYLYCDTPFVLPHSRSEFYQKSTDILLESWDQARQTPNVYKMREKRLVLRHLAACLQDQQGSDLFELPARGRRSLDFQSVFAQVASVLPSLNLDAGKDTQPLLKEVIERSGLLMEIDGGDRYQFAHLTLQEFFVADQFRDRADDLVARFGADAIAWREPIKLWCGLVGNSTSLIERIYQIDAIAAFECLADAQQVDQALADRIIEAFKGRLGEVAEGDAIVQAFAAVAANARSRGEAVFQFLEASLGGGESNRRIAAAQALSLTNLLRAAQVLAEHYSSEVRQPLIRMGDLAVPALKKLAESGNQNALNDLARIGTPGAAQVLVPFLWHSDAAMSGRTAWHLGTLISQPEVEAAFRECQLEKSQLNNKLLLDWVWEPFFGSTYDSTTYIAGTDVLSSPPVLKSALPIVANRIAYLLQEAPIETALSPLRLDPRLVIPVCAIALRQQVDLPKELSSQAALLEQQTITPEIEQQIRKEVNNLLGVKQSRRRWAFLLSSLPPKLQLDLLSRLINGRKTDKGDWSRLFRRIKYRFKTGWHYRIILGCALLLSAVALIQMFYLPFQSPQNWTSWLFGLNSLVIVYFWIFLQRGIEEPFAPDLFVNFGLFGMVTFLIELRRLYTQRSVWSGIEILFDITTNVNTVFNAVITTGTIVSAVVVIVVITGAIVGTIVGTISSLFEVAAGFGGIFAGLVFIAVSGIVAIAVFISVGNSGIRFWYRAKNKPDSRRFLAALAFPFFCWLPITVCYSTLAFLNFLSEWQVALLWVTIVLPCTLLWFYGQHKDYQARNPLQGIPELEKYRREPR
jgi:NACHT domain